MTPEIKNIVMADDDQDDIELFQSAVQDTCSALSLTIATDGTKLIEILNENPAPDTIFLDLNMLGVSGLDCLKEIRSKEKFDDVPVVMLSTSDRKAEIDYCLSNGADHYFVKPNTYAGLKSIIEELCSGHLSLTDKVSFHPLQKLS